RRTTSRLNTRRVNPASNAKRNISRFVMNQSKGKVRNLTAQITLCINISPDHRPTLIDLHAENTAIHGQRIAMPLKRETRRCLDKLRSHGRTERPMFALPAELSKQRTSRERNL